MQKTVSLRNFSQNVGGGAPQFYVSESFELYKRSWTDKGSNTFGLIIEMGIRLVAISRRNARNVKGKNVGGREY